MFGLVRTDRGTAVLDREDLDKEDRNGFLVSTHNNKAAIMILWYVWYHMYNMWHCCRYIIVLLRIIVLL